MTVLFFFILLASVQCIVYQHQVVNASCPCFFEFRVTMAGFGHRFFETLIGIHFSYILGCTFLSNEGTFLGYGKHGQYDKLEKYINIADGEQTRRSIGHLLSRPDVRVTYPFPSNQPECGALYWLDGISCTEAVEGWCVQLPNIYEPVSQVAREKFYRRKELGGAVSILGSTAESLTVVWHLRVGDYVIKGNDEAFYENIFDVLDQTILQVSSCFVVHFIFECETCGREPPDSHLVTKRLCEERNLTCLFHGNLSVEESLQAMIHASLLVTSGSSFSAVAGVLSHNVILFAENKDRHCPTCFLLNSHIRLSSEGTISRLEAMRTRAMIGAKFRHRIQNCRGLPSNN